MFGTHLRVSVGFRPYIFHGVVFHPMCQKERAAVFLRPSRVAHVSAHHCRSSVGLTPHDLVSYRTARTAFFEKLFYGVLGCVFWDALRVCVFGGGDGGV